MADISELIKFLLILATTMECLCGTMRRKNRIKGSQRKSLSGSFWELVKYQRPSYLRNVQIISRFGYYLEITEDGNVTTTRDWTSPNAVLEMSSYGVLYKRIRRPNSHYLAIDKDGSITTRPTASDITLFRENHGGSWMWYRRDDTRFILALKRNGKLRHKVTNRKHKAKTQFLIIPLCGRKRCVDNGLEDVR